ncbi:alpha-hydroxy acid oxidase [Nocardioides litoris]|uniref:alpha-hydroxy acid oxidase n=1 Tax=Nocardioides litoris TaxID=1926648 RepID=UPI00112430E3|nr:alpha-hydroxy acid oxidase [Nocardioides litoris]
MGDDALWVASLAERARGLLPEPVADYIDQGARDGISTAEAAAAWRRLRLRPHVLRDTRVVDPSVTVLGRALDVPLGVAPTTLQRAVHPDGECAVASAVAEVGGLLVVSSNAGTPFADIGATGVRWWVQSYLPADRALALPLLARAVDAGAEAVVLTLDTPVVGTKYARPGVPVVWDVVDPALLRVNFDAGYAEAPGSEKALDLGPGDITWLGRTTGLPVVVKGVLRGDDAVRCVEAGAAAVWVSNHGGRQLDRAVATTGALPEVVAAVDGRAEVYVDGGVRTGLDVATALALGASTAFAGRPVLHALAVSGAGGVRRWWQEMALQTVEALRLCGAATVADTRDLVAPDGLASL